MKQSLKKILHLAADTASLFFASGAVDREDMLTPFSIT